MTKLGRLVNDGKINNLEAGSNKAFVWGRRNSGLPGFNYSSKSWNFDGWHPLKSTELWGQWSQEYLDVGENLRFWRFFNSQPIWHFGSISGDLPALSAYQGAQADPKLAVGEGILGFFSVDSIWKQRLAAQKISRAFKDCVIPDIRQHHMNSFVSNMIESYSNYSSFLWNASLESVKGARDHRSFLSSRILEGAWEVLSFFDEISTARDDFLDRETPETLEGH